MPEDRSAIKMPP